MKFITWNVNGIRTRIFSDKTSAQNAKLSSINVEYNSPMFNILKTHDPDFICFQETRCSVQNGNKFKIEGYNSIFNESNGSNARDANRYSGTCIFYKEHFKINKVEYSIPEYQDDEGRIIIIYLDDFTLVNVYTPNSGTNFENRIKWQDAMFKFLCNLEGTVVYAGDLNVAWRDTDVHFCIPESPSYKKSIQSDIVGFLKEERDFIPEILIEKYKDAYITINNDESYEKKFTYWDARTKKVDGLPSARKNGRGWRIDYFLVKNCEVITCNTLQDVGTEYIHLNFPQGSDHCPLFLEIANWIV